MKKYFLLIVLLILWSTHIYADEAPMQPTQSGNVKPIENKDIQLKSEIINIYLNRFSYSVRVDYQFVNTGEKQKVIMGFPNQIQIGGGGRMITPIKNFKAWDGKKPLKIYQKEGEKNGKTFLTHSSDFGADDIHIKELYECFDITFEKGEKKNIINEYTQEYATDDEIVTFNLVEYILKTGALWKGKIESIKVFIHFKGLPKHELKNRYAYFHKEEEPNIDDSIKNAHKKKVGEFYVVNYNLKVEPNKYTMNGNTIQMTFKNIEPDFNIKVYLPPKLISGVVASSELKHKKISYSPKNAVDNDPTTAWVEGKAGNGIGESIEVNTTIEQHHGDINGLHKIEKIGIINGYAKNKDIFFSNNRVKRIMFEYYYISKYDGKKSKKMFFDLKDQMEIQYIRFKKPILTGSFKITILDVYKGTKYNDTAISEIQVFTAK
ncbi:MAG: hypothetical protein OEV44_06465 [Spirochaetota bacterium]|nr:hypothetical protein [Spirochaetota bacterium]